MEAGCSTFSWRAAMLWTIVGILLALWLLGIVSAYTFGGFINVLLIAAVGVVLLRAIQGGHPV
jgi:hypothetical protein